MPFAQAEVRQQIGQGRVTLPESGSGCGKVCKTFMRRFDPAASTITKLPVFSSLKIKTEEIEAKLYSHCTVKIVAVNTDTRNERTLTIPLPGERYTLTSPALTSTSIMLNGNMLRAAPDGSIPRIHGVHYAAGGVVLSPASITFFSVPSSGNQYCGK